MIHECQIEKRSDDLAVAGVEQYLLRCRCHSTSWQVWRPGDPDFRCPAEVEQEPSLFDERVGAHAA